MHTRSIGNFYETIAAEAYKRAGFRIVRRNLTCRFGEIDILAHDGKSLWIVEVRGRSTGEYPPHRFLTPQKIARLKRLANWVSHRYQSVVRIELAEILGAIPARGCRRIAIWFPAWFGIRITKYPIL